MNNHADICLILEGTYPYVEGGVSAWTHELITRQSHLDFHLVCILPPKGECEEKFILPPNVTGITQVRLQRLREGGALPKALDGLVAPLDRITTGVASLDDLEQVREVLSSFRVRPGAAALLDSEAAWTLLEAMYEANFADTSFLDYFWSWRTMLGGLYSVMTADLPKADVYHALSTGYAGLYAARAKLETGRPVMLTEHGIYTNERRIEIAQAEWLDESITQTLSIDDACENLRDFWIDSFTNFSRIGYEAADEIVTLYAGNQVAQLADGADPARMRVIPNGIDVQHYGAIQRVEHERPTIALIGRVVPIKDVKGFLRVCSMLREHLPDLKAYVMGSASEDVRYAGECKEMVRQLSLSDTVEFTGQVSIDSYLPEIDLVVLSSISEAQPLVILEAGAAGVPCVATDAGACREMIEGDREEKPTFGNGGLVVPMANPAAMADAVFSLLSDRELYRQYAEAIRRRVHSHYTQEQQQAAYRELYAAYKQAATPQ